MKKAIAYLLLFFLCHAADAQEVYLDVGLGHIPIVQEVKDGPTQYVPTYENINGPFALIEAGIEYRGFSASILHMSSVTTEKDRGINFIGVKYRFKHLGL